MSTGRSGLWIAAAAAAALVAAGAYFLLSPHARPRSTVSGHASLKPAAPPSTTLPGPKPRAPSPSPTGPTAAAARPAPTLALLRINADVPGASVFLDHRFVGRAPVEVRDVAPGPHRLNVSAEGQDMYAETLDVAAGPREVTVRFKEVRLDEALEVVHRHGLGSCLGRLSATPAGLRYDTDHREDVFAIALGELEPLQVDYIKKSLRVKVRGGKTYNFTTRDGDADTLLKFQQKVEAARKRS